MLRLATVALLGLTATLFTADEASARHRRCCRARTRCCHVHTCGHQAYTGCSTCGSYGSACSTGTCGSACGVPADAHAAAPADLPAGAPQNAPAPPPEAAAPAPAK